MEEKLYFTRQQAFKSAYKSAARIDRNRREMIRLPDTVDDLEIDWYVSVDAIHAFSVSETSLFSLRNILRSGDWALYPWSDIEAGALDEWRAYSGDWRAYSGDIRSGNPDSVELRTILLKRAPDLLEEQIKGAWLDTKGKQMLDKAKDLSERSKVMLEQVIELSDQMAALKFKRQLMTVFEDGLWPEKLPDFSGYTLRENSGHISVEADDDDDDDGA